MSSPSAELQKALFVTLSANMAVTDLLADGAIFDHAPAKARFPYMTIGRTSAYDWSTSTEGGSEHLLTIHVWSQAKGKIEAFAIMEAVTQALDGFQPALDGHALISFRLEFSEAAYDEDAALYHGLQRYRALIEQTG